MRNVRLCLTSLCFVLMIAMCSRPAAAASADEGWDVAVYPVLAWIPLGINVDVDVPPFGNDGGGRGDILDSHLDGAFLAGVSASNGPWRIEADAIWASFGGDRLDRPNLTVDLDLIYGHANLGRRIAPSVYLTGGVRRLSLDYDVTLGNLPHFSRKPGVWDPVVGIGWHSVGPKVEWHAAFEGGGFGVGADVDISAGARVDWKPIPHFGITGGYNILYLKVTDTIVSRDLTLKTTLHGPVVGIGLYF